MVYIQLFIVIHLHSSVACHKPINLSAHVQLRDCSVTSFLAAVPMARRNDVSTLQRSLQSFAIASGPATFYAEGLRPLLNSFVVPYLGI